MNGNQLSGTPSFYKKDISISFLQNGNQLLHSICTLPKMVQDSTRLFVGNLVSSISNEAITRLVGKFGTVSAFERDEKRGFAHLSLHGSVDQCLSTLNQTRWMGTVLRVEKATEHFLDRLQSEWALLDVAQQTIANELIAENVMLPVVTWTGKRTLFDGVDDAVSKIAANVRNVCAVSNETVSNRRSNQAMQPTRSARSGVTMDLFGLAQVQDTEPRSTFGSQLILLGDSNSKKGSSIMPFVDDTTAMTAIGNDPTKIDVGAEHLRAAGVIDMVLGNWATDVSCGSATPKRKAAYVKLLLQVEVRSKHRRETSCDAFRNGSQDRCCQRGGVYTSIAMIR